MIAVAMAVAVVAAGLTFWATRALIARAARLGLDDIPNHRSSHRKITPRGGGLAFVAATAGVLAALALLGVASTTLGWTLALGGCLGLAVVGLIDDLRSLGQRLRFGCQGIAVALILHAAVGEDSPLIAALSWPPAGWIALLILLLAGLWWINLFNFMDGIDGIATMQALFMLCSLLVVQSLSAVPANTAAAAGTDLVFWAALVLAAALFGFLPFNWPPARIFMGDVGSLFLGVSMFLVAMHSVTSGRMSAWFWPIAASSFVCDASVTLLRRLVSGQNVFSAHRSHFYQQLSRRWSDHRRVTLVYSVINISWFLPLATLSHLFPRFGGALLVAAWIPALIFLWRAGAGKPDPEPIPAGGQHTGGTGDPATAPSERGRVRTEQS